MKGFTSLSYAKALFYDFPIPIAYVSDTGKFLEVNAAWVSMLGYAESALLEMTFQEITHPADLNEDLEMVRKLRLDKNFQGYSMVKRYITKKGDIVWINLCVRAIWEGDEFSHFVSIADPLPNHGNFKTKKKGEEIHVRPVVKVYDFIMDNKKVIFPVATAIGAAAWWVAKMFYKVLIELDLLNI